MRFVLASSNPHKAVEIAALLPEHVGITLQSALGVSSPAETGTTFVENALIKAKHASGITGLPAIADDSGLCVDALGGLPGVVSARYAGEKAGDGGNMMKLLAALEGEGRRTATFHCVLVCLASPQDPSPLIAEGSWRGEIGLAPTGDGGFGYDPVFRVPSLARTAAQLTPDEKNAISHRGLALRVLLDKLSERYPA